MPTSSNLDDAIVAKLLADAPLMALAANTVAWDIAPQGATSFVIVSLLGSADTLMFGVRAFEESTYLVKFVEKNTSAINAKSAAARIDAVLEWATLTPAGYGPVTMQRTERVRYTEVDEANARWQHWGAMFGLMGSAP
jgi:hypothetical protein